MGKYAGVELPPLPVEDQNRQTKIDFEKSKIPTTSPVELTILYARLRTEKSVLKEMLSALELKLDAVTQLIIGRFEAEGLTNLRILSGESLSTEKLPYAKVENPGALRLWVIAQGMENQLALMWQKTNSLTKERLLAGEPEPDGVKAYFYTKLVLRGRE